MKTVKAKDTPDISPALHRASPASRSTIIRLSGIAILGTALLIAGFIIRQRVGERYRKSQILLREYNTREAARLEIEKEAKQHEQEIVALRAEVTADPTNVSKRWKLADRLQKFKLVQAAQIG